MLCFFKLQLGVSIVPTSVGAVGNSVEAVSDVISALLHVEADERFSYLGERDFRSFERSQVTCRGNTLQMEADGSRGYWEGMTPAELTRRVSSHDLASGLAGGSDFSSTRCTMRGKRLILRDEDEVARSDRVVNIESRREEDNLGVLEPKLQRSLNRGCGSRGSSGKDDHSSFQVGTISVNIVDTKVESARVASGALSSLVNDYQHKMDSSHHNEACGSGWASAGVDCKRIQTETSSRMHASQSRHETIETRHVVVPRHVSLKSVQSTLDGEGCSDGCVGSSGIRSGDVLEQDDEYGYEVLLGAGVSTTEDLAVQPGNGTSIYPVTGVHEDTDMALDVRSSLERHVTRSRPRGDFLAQVNRVFEPIYRECTSNQKGVMFMKMSRAERKKISVADKMYSKRAKFFPLSGRRHHSSVPSEGSSSSSFSRTNSPHGWENVSSQSMRQGGASETPARGDNIEPMESDGTGGGDDDDGAFHAVPDGMEDNEVRMDLTDDLLLKVFSFLDDTALCQAAMVCKQWRAASAHEDFWKSLNFENREVSHEQVGRLCNRYPRATQLNLRGAPCVDEMLVREAMRSLRNLEVLTLGRGILSEGFFHALGVECAALQSLSITDAILGTGGAQEIQLRHESLRRLQIQKCRVLRIAIRCPQLEFLCLKRTGTASAMLICPRLVTLDLSSCSKLSDAGVRAAATSCPLLASLDISNCPYVSDETLREISLACNNLRTLDASYCPNISLEGVRMPMLVDLKLQNCEGIISSSMAALSSCSMLEVLNMDFCWLLTAVNLDLPRLRQISLSNIKKFVELTLRSPALVSLNLTNCPILSRVDITSTSLQTLALRQQSGLSSMALQCPWLREIDLTECESLTNSVCEVFSDAGGCPRLSSLILDSCEGLTEVNLSSSSVQSLSLVGCRNIRALSLACPVLQNLVLDGCDHLQQASFSPVGLSSLNLGICPHLIKLEIEASQMTLLDLRGCGILSQAAISCPSLSSLDASYCSQLGDDCLIATTYACPAIQSLVLASCPSVGPVGLLALKRLRNLTMLDLSYTFLTDLSPIFEACPRLQAVGMQVPRENALDALHGGGVLPELRELDLSYGSLGRTAIERVMASCPHLSHVSLNGCAHVTDDLWKCLTAPPIGGVPCRGLSNMEDIGMGDGSIDGTAMDERLAADEETVFTADVTVGKDEETGPSSLIYSSGPSGYGTLRVMDSNETSTTSELFESSPALDPEIGVVRALQSLSCVGCPRIKVVYLPPFAACSQLTSLNLSLSVNIRDVQLHCTNLTSLNLSNCSGLEELELQCPRLMSLFLQYCGIEARILERAIEGCGQLETLDVRNCSKVFAESLANMRAACPGLKRLHNTVSS